MPDGEAYNKSHQQKDKGFDEDMTVCRRSVQRLLHVLRAVENRASLPLLSCHSE